MVRFLRPKEPSLRRSRITCGKGIFDHVKIESARFRDDDGGRNGRRGEEWKKGGGMEERGRNGRKGEEWKQGRRMMSTGEVRRLDSPSAVCGPPTRTPLLSVVQTVRR